MNGKKKAGPDSNWLESAGNGLNGYYGWKLIKMTIMMLENQLGWPNHSFECVLFYIVKGCPAYSELYSALLILVLT